MGAEITTPPTRLRDWDAGAPYIKDTVYQAATDGFVLATVASAAADLIGYTDGNNPPATLRIRDGWQGLSGSALGIMMAVKKSDYWEITNDQTPTIYWIPLKP